MQHVTPGHYLQSKLSGGNHSAVCAQVHKVRQKFIVDASLYCNLVTAGTDDNPKDTPDWTAIYRHAALSSLQLLS